MIWLILSVCCTVSMLITFRILPKYQIDTFQAIVVNYIVCVLTGYLFIDQEALPSDWTLNSTWALLAAATGIIFIGVFYAIAVTAQKISLTVASVAARMSMVIPVLVSLFITKTSNDFNWIGYFGLVLAFASIYMSGYKDKAQSSQNELSAFWLVALPIIIFVFSGIADTFINVANTYYLRDAEAPLYPMATFATSFVIGFVVIMGKLIRKESIIKAKNIIAGVLLGIPNYFSIYFILKALTSYNNEGAVVFPIAYIATILAATAFSVYLFRERLTPLNRLGVFLAILSIALISLRNYF